ncbi:MAG: phasin family protein [Kiloniellaceae bacterium]
MAKKSGTTESKEGAPQVDVESLVASNDETLKAVMKANEAVLEGMVTVGREIMEFGTARFRRDLETQGSLMRCKDVEEAFRVQCDYAREATQQYFEEVSKLMNLTAKIGRECWAPLEDRTREALHEIGPH